jgi:hypothetical protein
MRQHGSLKNDAETNEAAWEAARGAASGAAKVRVVLVFRALCTVFRLFAAIDLFWTLFLSKIPPWCFFIPSKIANLSCANDSVMLSSFINTIMLYRSRDAVLGGRR